MCVISYFLDDCDLTYNIAKGFCYSTRGPAIQDDIKVA